MAVFKKVCFIPPMAVSKEKASDAHSSINIISRRVRIGSWQILSHHLLEKIDKHIKHLVNSVLLLLATRCIFINNFAAKAAPHLHIAIIILTEQLTELRAKSGVCLNLYPFYGVMCPSQHLQPICLLPVSIGLPVGVTSIVRHIISINIGLSITIFASKTWILIIFRVLAAHVAVMWVLVLLFWWVKVNCFWDRLHNVVFNSFRRQEEIDLCITNLIDKNVSLLKVQLLKPLSQVIQIPLQLLVALENFFGFVNVNLAMTKGQVLQKCFLIGLTVPLNIACSREIL